MYVPIRLFYYTKAQITEQDLLNFSHKVTYKKAIASTTPVAVLPPRNSLTCGGHIVANRSRQFRSSVAARLAA